MHGKAILCLKISILSGSIAVYYFTTCFNSIGCWFRTMSKRRLVFLILGAPILWGVVANLWVAWAASGKELDAPSELPDRAVVVVLGVSESRPDLGAPITTYAPRLDAAAELVATGRVDDIVVSGTKEQADAMAAGLMLRGVTQRITRDPYGWRTLDSVARARACYPGRTVVFVSQGWHNTRAIWIAERLGVDARGYAAASGEGFDSRVKAPLRDVFAKPKAMIDWLMGFPLTTDVPPGEGNR